MVIKTSSVDYDERLKKEIDSILNIGGSEVSVFAVEDYKSSYNKAGVEVYNPLFFFRNKKGIFKILTLIELIVRIKRKYNTRTFDNIWIHDPIMLIIIPFLKLKDKKSVIWDLHELPPELILNRSIFKWIFKKYALLCTVIVANEERGEFMIKKGLLEEFKVLHNYPVIENENFTEYRDVEFDKWTHNKEFAYCQSATHPSRNFIPLAKACVRMKQFLVVVGEKNEVYKEARKLIDDFDKYILVIGKKASEKLGYYISKAKFSFVFYSNINMNNYLCAPNRLYHSLKLGIPAIVGSNPTMRNIVEEDQCGIVLNGFGEASEDIEKAIVRMNENFKTIKSNTESILDKYNWSNQEVIIKDIFYN